MMIHNPPQIAASTTRYNGTQIHSLASVASEKIVVDSNVTAGFVMAKITIGLA